VACKCLVAIVAATGSASAEVQKATEKEEEKKKEKKRSGWLGLPVLSYAPETSLVFGAFGMRYFRLDDESHDTTLSALLTASLKKQFAFEFQPEIYFNQNDYRIGAHLIAQSFPERFYGVGNAVSEATAENYNRRSVRLLTNFRRRIAGEFYGGVTTEQLLLDLDVTDPDGLLATRDYVGEAGGFSSGIGLAASYDDRDDRTFTTRGAFIELAFLPFLRAFGSRYQFWRTTLDARYFVPTWSRQALGMRYFSDVTRGEVPFYQLPQFGGHNSLRGYFRGKYRDLTAHTLEAEYRAHLFWYVGAAAFAGVGQVGRDFGAMLSARLRPAVGGGLRFDLSGGDNYNLRVDAAGWAGEFAVYISVLEAF
jgi:outer membrane protein assembly factor BamA